MINIATSLGTGSYKRGNTPLHSYRRTQVRRRALHTPSEVFMPAPLHFYFFELRGINST